MNEKSFSKKKLIKEYLNFDWKSYINSYDDLINIKTKEDAWYHWINYGKLEGRFVNILINDKDIENFIHFDWKQYVSNYPDLSYIKTKKEAWKHWNCHGKNENRAINGKNNKDEKEDFLSNTEFIHFDWKTYVNNYNDLLYIDSKEKAWKHWINYGKKENRICENIFLFGTDVFCFYFFKVNANSST